jgi:hypothetical protein
MGKNQHHHLFFEADPWGALPVPMLVILLLWLRAEQSAQLLDETSYT